MLWVNRITGAALIALTIPFWRMSGDYPEMARLFPRVMLLAIGLLAAIMIVRSFIPAVAPVGEGEGSRAASAFNRPLLTFGLLLIAIVVGEQIDLFAAMAVLAVLLIPVLGVRRWRPYLVACLILMMFVYGLFVVFLKVPMTSIRLPGL
ncbi:MAG: tripartite tricarboxylate transporter TctB family protein [Xanthobacteraceae bacterium]